SSPPLRTIEVAPENAPRPTDHAPEAIDTPRLAARARRLRPCCCRAAKRGYEFSPSDVDWHEPLPCRAASEAYHNADLPAPSAKVLPGARTHAKRPATANEKG